ncbi:MAG: acetolactate synthase [Alphaproteobacteria bacterium]|nr:acetolactate synthase [Alphaproteobacteria bacterium]
MPRTVGSLLAACLDAHGVDLMYCVPGESYLGLVDALREFPKIRLIVCRHEGGAGYMAVADGRMRGKAGVCFVSRGPGATNASIAIHTAWHDATPSVFFIGQAERHEMGRLALQEQNYSKLFCDMTKAVFEVNQASQMAEICARAFHLAEAGTPGPVVVVLPEDLLDEPCEEKPVPATPRPRAGATSEDMDQLAEMLARAERPLVFVGATVHGEQALADLVTLAERWGLPVCPTHRRPHLFPSDHPNYGAYIGNRAPKAQLDLLKQSDLLLVLGERLSQSVTQGYTFPAAPVPQLPMVHVWPDAAEVGRVWRPTLGIAADPDAVMRALLARTPPKVSTARREWIGRLNAIHRDLTRPIIHDSNDGVPFGNVVVEVGKHLAANAAVTSDAGNFSTFIHRYMWFKQSQMFLASGVGAMGSAVPMAVAAALRRKGQQAVAFVGDGGALMTGNELATAVQFEAPIKIILSDNGSYGTIRFHQEGRYPGRVDDKATRLKNPDFAAWAESFGARGFTIRNQADVERLIPEAMAETKRSVLVHVHTSMEHLTAWKRMSEMPAYVAKS